MISTLQQQEKLQQLPVAAGTCTQRWRRLLAWALLLLACQCHVVAAAAAAPPHAGSHVLSSSSSSSSSSGVAAAAPGQQRVVIIVGSTGSRAVYSVLQAAGVWMHPDADRDLNARAFTELVLPFLTRNTSALRQPRMDWNNSTHPAPFFDRVCPPAQQPALDALHRRLAARLAASVPADAPVWAWKHPNALYTLPSLVKAFPGAHIIHQVQDGRDYALRNTLRHSGGRQTRGAPERYFVQLLTGFPALTGASSSSRSSGGGSADGAQQAATITSSLAYSEAVARAWSLANLFSLKWAGQAALGLTQQHSIARLEDLCAGDGLDDDDDAGRRRADAAASMLRHAGLAADQAAVLRAVERLQACRCRHGAWKAAWRSRDARRRAAVRRIDASVAGALQAFDYVPVGRLPLPPWLQAQGAMDAVVARARRIADGGRAPLVLTFAGLGYEGMVGNWLAWARDAARADTSRVLCVARPEALARLRPVLARFGAHGHALPALSPPAAARGHSEVPVDAWRHERSSLWLERVRVLHALVTAGVPVVLSDLDAIWVGDPLPALAGAGASATGADAGAGAPRGFDLVLSRGFFPSVVHAKLKVAGCCGFLFANATAPAASFLAGMLREKLRQLAVVGRPQYFNDQYVLNTGLVHADLSFNVSLASPDPARWAAAGIAGARATTAPQSLAVLFLPESDVLRQCQAPPAQAPSTMQAPPASVPKLQHDGGAPGAVGSLQHPHRPPASLVVHCQSSKSGAEKQAALQQLGLWREWRQSSAARGPDEGVGGRVSL